MASQVIFSDWQEEPSDLDKKELAQTHVNAVGECRVAADLDEQNSELILASSRLQLFSRCQAFLWCSTLLCCSTAQV